MVLLILFSSTSTAGKLGGLAFNGLLQAAARYHRLGADAYRITVFTAEKSVHVALFLLFGLALWNTWPKDSRTVEQVMAAGAIVGIASEILQMFFAGRDPTIRDALLNCGSLAIGVALASRVWYRRPAAGK